MGYRCRLESSALSNLLSSSLIYYRIAEEDIEFLDEGYFSDESTKIPSEVVRYNFSALLPGESTFSGDIKRMLLTDKMSNCY